MKNTIIQDHGTWEARIMHNYKIIILGYFKDKMDAVDARRRKELELFGEFSVINREVAV
jgi:hypothetical protein